jgi:hypothetical protein
MNIFSKPRHISHVGKIKKMYTQFWQQILKGRYHLQDLGTDNWIILKWILEKGKIWTGFVCPKMWTSDGQLRTLWRTFGFRKSRRIS